MLYVLQERDPDTGLAVACQHGEAGELVGRIDRGHPVRDYHGYADQSSTSKKMMQDVFRKGDLYFRFAHFWLAELRSASP